MIYETRNDFCSTTIFINSDSTFLKESGCEGRSHITIGTWKVHNDSIELNSIEKNRLSLVSYIRLSTNHNNNIGTTFKFYDKTGYLLPGVIITPIKTFKKYQFTSSSPIVIGTNGSKLQNYSSNDHGLITIVASNYDTLIFPQLELLTNKKFRIATRNLPDTVAIYMNTNNLAFAYSEVQYNSWDNPVKFSTKEYTLRNNVHK